MAIYATDASGKRVKVAGGGSGGGGGTAGVTSFNGRTGAVTPQAGDYTAEMVGAVPAGQGGVGRSMAGETVELSDGTTVTAEFGAEVFNDSTFKNKATGRQSHAEGAMTEAIGEYSHSEGHRTKASGSHTHAEGYETTASGIQGAHAEGQDTVSSGWASHAEGKECVASANYAHAEGERTTAGAQYSHTEGQNTSTVGDAWGAHAEGRDTVATGIAAHAEGEDTQAKGWWSHAGGEGTIANMAQYAIGTYNVEKDGGSSGSLLIVGKGTSNTERSNAFRVAYSGAYGIGAWNSSGADYAELFEWADGNPEHEDRAGLFVTLEGENIRIAGPEDDYILGVVSASPSVVGDVYDDQWQGMFVRDVFGRTVQEERDIPAQTAERPGPDGQIETVEIIPARREMAPKINPNYDNTVKYQPRTQRPEWDAVGLMGKLVAVDDGTCQPDGWATVGPGGKATTSAERTKYRVMARLDDTHIKIMIL